jgi:hypothetical protein
MMTLAALSLGYRSDASAVDRATFTTAMFVNAPESIMKITNVKWVSSDTVELNAITRPCAAHHGGIYTVIVRNAKAAHFVPNQFIISGYGHEPNSKSALEGLAVRHISNAELKASYSYCVGT